MSLTTRRATRGEIEAFYGEAKPKWNFAEFPLWQNSRFKEVPWDRFSDPGYTRLTNAQQVLNNLAVLQTHTYAKGVESFFRMGQDCVEFQQAVAALGWNELMRRFDGVFVHAFGSLKPDWSVAMKRANAAIQEMGSHRPYIEFSTWFRERIDDGSFSKEVLRYCRAHERDLFEIVS